MRCALAFAVVALAGCGDETFVAPDGGGGTGGLGTSAVGTTSAATTTTAATGGAGGGAGGEGPAPSLRLVTVESYDFMPEEGVHVVGHDASGAVVDHQLTGRDGMASVLAPDDGMVTIGYERERVLPDGNGGSSSAIMGRLHTLAPIDDRAALSHRIVGSRLLVENAPMTIELTAAVPSGSYLYAFPTCGDPYAMQAAAVGFTALEVRGCAGEPTFDLVVVATEPEQVVGRKVFSGILLEPGQSLALAVNEAELEPLPDDHQFSAPGATAMVATAWGVDGLGNYRSSSPSLFGSTTPSYAFPAPPGAGVASWLVQERVALSGDLLSRLRQLPAIPASSAWEPPEMVMPSPPSVSTFAPNRPASSWALAGGGTHGHTVSVLWFGWGGASDGNQTQWRLLLPPGSTSAVYPALPPAMQAKLPGDDGPSFVTAFVLAAESTGAGIEEIFAYEWIDQVVSFDHATKYP
jgi:hypothetical protein